METNYRGINEKRVERILLLVFSVYALAMAVAAILLGWGSWVVEIILITLAVSWTISIRQYKTYRFRAYCTSAMVWLDCVIYGLYAKNYFTVLATMAALIILLSVYCIPELVNVAVVISTLLLLYHGFVAGTIHVTSVREGFGMALQIVSFYVVACAAHYLLETLLESNERLLKTIGELKQVEQSKDDFLANVSHEIRTPINTVCGMSEMVLREDVPDAVRADIFDIQTAGRNLLSVVSDILDFSELASGRLELVEEVYNLTSTINDVMNMTIAQKNGKNIELIVDCDANIPSGLLGDEQKIRRVMENVVNNAIKFTTEGCVTVRISARKEEYGINLIIKVADTGIGIKKADLEKLFTSFNQVDTKKNRKEGGVGLGLAISQAIVKKMGGFISVRSEYGKGTEVTVVVPQKVVEETPIVSVSSQETLRVLSYINMEKYSYQAIRDGYTQTISHIARQLGIYCRQCRNLAELKRRLEKEKYTHIFISWEEYCEDRAYFDELSEKLQVILILEREHAEAAGGRLLRIYKPFYVLSVASVLNGETVVSQSLTGSSHQLRRFIAPQASVLVVDDNMMNLKVVEGLLRPYKIKVFVAESGAEALKKIESMEFDFVFMDHMMPEMDGVETLHNIRQKPGKYFKTVPIIALTANAIGGAREMFLAEGFQDFVAKPIEISVLERVLKRHIPPQKLLKAEDDMPQEQAAHKTEKTKETAEQTGAKALHLEGIDVNQGIAYCGGSREDYLEIAATYHRIGLTKQQEIEDAYNKGDWKNYTILVHAVKSTSLGIGAGALSKMAERLEQAGKEENEAYIRQNHAEMQTEYRRVLAVLEAEESICPKEQKTIGQEEQTTGDLPELGREELFESLAKLEELLETFESEGVSGQLESLSGYQYQGRPLSELLSGVQQKVREFDFMGAIDELAAVKGNEVEA